MNEDVLNSILFKVIQFVQYLSITVFLFLFVLGIARLLTARKNPRLKRQGYLFALFGFIGLILFTYGPVFFFYYFVENSFKGFEILLENMQDSPAPLIWFVYKITFAILEPILIFSIYMGIAYLLLRAKEPMRGRLGLILICGSSSLWILLKYASEITDFFFRI